MSIRVNFNGEQVITLYDISFDEELSIIKLETQLIDKVYPEHNEDHVLVPFESIP